MSKNKENLLKTVFLFLLFVLFTLIVKFVGLSSIGPGKSEVGLAFINEWFHNLFGFNNLFYKLSKYLGYLPFLFVLFYGCLGLKQLIDKKSLKKVDKKIIYLGCFYVLMGLFYIFFEKVIINYRPVLLEGDLEASYPSSHTILAVCICISSIMMNRYYLKKDLLKYVNVSTAVLMLLIVVGRLFSGVHWLTDIVGGLLLSSALCYLFFTFIHWDSQYKK